MENAILTKEEHNEKLNELIKPVVNFAINTKQFDDNGCYSEEFISEDGKEVSLMIVDKSWVLVENMTFNDLVAYRRMYHQLEREYEKLKNESKYRKKFMGIF